MLILDASTGKSVAELYDTLYIHSFISNISDFLIEGYNDALLDKNEVLSRTDELTDFLKDNLEHDLFEKKSVVVVEKSVRKLGSSLASEIESGNLGKDFDTLKTELKSGLEAIPDSEMKSTIYNNLIEGLKAMMDFYKEPTVEHFAKVFALGSSGILSTISDSAKKVGVLPEEKNILEKYSTKKSKELLFKGLDEKSFYLVRKSTANSKYLFLTIKMQDSSTNLNPTSFYFEY